MPETVITPPAQTPPPNPTPAPPAADSTDTFMADMLKSLNKVLLPDGNIGDAPAAAPEPRTGEPDAVVHSSPKLGEMVMDNERRTAEKKAGESAAPPPVPNEPPKPENPPAAPPAPRLKKKETPTNAPGVIGSHTHAPPAAPAPVPPAPAPAIPPSPAADPDAQFIATLDEVAKDELALAEFAEKNFPEMKGQRGKVLGFLKQVNDFKPQDPGARDEELARFIEEKKPQYAPGQRRKVENRMIAQEAASHAREEVLKEVQPKLSAAEAKLREQELAPLFAKAEAQFDDLMTSRDTAPAETMETVDPDMIKLVREKGYAAAAKLYPIEAPIYDQTARLANTWMRLTNGAEKFDVNNPHHKWLVDFVDRQGKIYQAKPESTVNGRRFVPLMEYLSMARERPQEVGQFYSFQDQDVLQMLATNGTLQMNARLAELKEAGFERKPRKVLPDAQKPTTPAPAPESAKGGAPNPPEPSKPASPRMGGNSLPAPGSTTPATVRVDPAMEQLWPGSSKVITGVGSV